jgi:hypothetical protein
VVQTAQFFTSGEQLWDAFERACNWLVAFHIASGQVDCAPASGLR